MRDVIQSVIATEAEARRLVAAAQAEADRLLADAGKQCLDLAARGRQEARAEADRMIEAVAQEAEHEKQEDLVRAAAEIETQVRLEPAVQERAVVAAVRCVCGPP